MRKAIIIGAGPAGLTAALELQKLGNIRPIILESSADIGGLSKTINYHGNRIDIGGHRFFSREDKIIDWWLEILPLELTSGNSVEINYHRKSKIFTASQDQALIDPLPGKHMLIRNRKSRIFYNKHFFDYPVSLNRDTIKKLGLFKLLSIGFSYLKARVIRHKTPVTLEDFLISNFGRTLYRTFFKDYTEKVWGVPCNKIPAAWGKQRIKDLSLTKTLLHALRKRLTLKGDDTIQQKSTSTSLIEKFLYPSLGPGQLWEEVAARIISKGGEIHRQHTVNELQFDETGKQLKAITALNTQTNFPISFEGDYFISTMPVQDLVKAMQQGTTIPKEVRTTADGLEYRDFVIIGILLKKQDFKNPEGNGELLDNWIYVQDKDVAIGRIQFFNNWSPFMVTDKNTIWLGLEYFCSKGDALWNLSDTDFTALGIKELIKIGFIQNKAVLDTTIIRIEKAYPGYFGTYHDFDNISSWLNNFENLFLIGRNGMHKYNNTDHSMLTAMQAVDNIKNSVTSKENIWNINTEEVYNEKK